MTLLEFGAAFLAVTPDVHHYGTHKKLDKYIVWAEDGQDGASYADGKMHTQYMGGTLDYFTKTEFDPNAEAIQAVLNSLPVAWELVDVLPPDMDENGYIHHIWRWQLGVSPHA